MKQRGNLLNNIVRLSGFVMQNLEFTLTGESIVIQLPGVMQPGTHTQLITDPIPMQPVIFMRSSVSLPRNLATKTSYQNLPQKSSMPKNGLIFLQNREQNSQALLPNIMMVLPCGIPGIQNGMLPKWVQKEMLSANSKKRLKRRI